MGKRVLIGVGVLALVILAAGGGYFYGISVGEARADQARQQLFGERLRGQGGQFPGPLRTVQPGQEGRAGLAGAILGTIEAIEGDTLVVNTEEGNIQVRTTDTTLIEKTKSVGVEELEIGEQVMISGSRSDDGSITARSIQPLRAGQFARPDQP